MENIGNVLFGVAWVGTLIYYFVSLNRGVARTKEGALAVLALCVCLWPFGAIYLFLANNRRT